MIKHLIHRFLLRFWPPYRSWKKKEYQDRLNIALVCQPMKHDPFKGFSESPKLVYRPPNPETMNPSMKAKYEKALEISRQEFVDVFEEKLNE